MEMEHHPEKPLIDSFLESLVMIDSFLESLVTEKGYSHHTRRAYRKDLLDFFSFLDESRFADSAGQKSAPVVKLKQIDGIMLRGYLGFLHRKNKKSTIARKLSAIRSFFKYLVKNGIISENPAELVLTPKQDKTLPVYLSVDEMFRLLDSIQTDTLLGLRNRAIFETLYSSGIRVSELSEMNFSDVDFSAAVVFRDEFFRCRFFGGSRSGIRQGQQTADCARRAEGFSGDKSIPHPVAKEGRQAIHKRRALIF
jgi:site-specific recombinase XerD